MGLRDAIATRATTSAGSPTRFKRSEAVKLTADENADGPVLRLSV